MPSSSNSFVSGASNYIQNLRRFSRNAQLYLFYALSSGLGTGIWTVMFNLYLLRIGYELSFVGLFWFLDMIFHGLFALPAGLIADKIGRRKTFVLATTWNILARGALLFTLDPTLILILAALAGMGEGFHAVVGAPFIMENSEPEERPHLFALDSSFSSISTFVGSISGGLLPLAWASLWGVPALDPVAARWALVTSLPLTMLALVPLVFMREKPAALVESFADLITLRHVVSHGIIAKLVLCSALVGVAFGLTTRFFNVFFSVAHGASDDQVGTILASGALGSAVIMLMSPVMNRRWGRVRSIVFSQLLSIPFLLLMAITPTLGMVWAFFVLRGSIYSISMPLRQQLAMEFITSRERGTTNGLVHMVFDLGGGLGALSIGLFVVNANFMPAFTAAAAIFIVPAALYYVFFDTMEERRRVAVPT